MWKKILMAGNGPEQDRLAIEEAVALAKRFGSSLNIVAVVDVNEEFEATAPGLTDKLGAKAKKELDQLIQRAAKDNIQAVGSVAIGETHVRVNEKVKETGADLVIMGTRGRTGLRRFLMGSVSSHVIGHTDCDVLAVRGEPKRGQYKKILASSDGSKASEHAIAEACKIAKEFGAELTLLNVIPVYGDQVDLATKTGLSEVFAVESKAIMNKAKAVAEQYGVSVQEIVVEEGYPADEIVRVANEEKIDLIVLGKYGKTGVSQLVMGSTAQQVLEQARVPVLVVKT